jgi:hypothetical protein
LQFTLVADDAGTEERVAIVLHQKAMDDREIQMAIQNKARTSEVWTFDLRFSKAGGTR